MTISNVLHTTGFGLLALCFAISLGRVVSYDQREADPDTFIIRYAHYIQEESVEAGLQAIAETYMNAHPGVLIEPIVVPRSVYRSWVQTKLTGNVASDLILLDTVPAREQIMFNFFTLNEFMEKPNPYNRGTVLEDKPWRETFVDHLSGPPTYWNSLGAYWGVPLVANTTRVIANRSLFRRITGAETFPKDFETFITLCEKVRTYSQQSGAEIFPIAAAGRQSPFIHRLIESQTLPLMIRCDWSRRLKTYGHERKLGYIKGRWSFEADEIRLGLTLAQEVCQYMQPGFLQHDARDTLFYFGQGKALMILADSGIASSIKAQVPFEVGAFEIPFPDKAHPIYGETLLGRPSEGANISRWAFGITRQSPHPEIALDFLHYLTALETNQRFADLTGSLPSVVGASVPEQMEIFAARVHGYPNGISPGSNVGNEASVFFNAHVHLLLSPDGGLERFLAKMRQGYLSAILRDLHSHDVGIIQKLRFMDTDLAAEWIMHSRGLDSGHALSAEDPEKALGRILFSQVHFDADRYWLLAELADEGLAFAQ